MNSKTSVYYNPGRNYQIMNNDISQKYRDEMMKYYNLQKKRNPAENNYEKHAAVPSAEEQSVPSAPYNDIRQNSEPDITAKYPDPDLSEYRLQENSSYTAPETTASEIPDSEYGRLRVEASSGSRSSPVEDVLVIITRKNGDSKEVLATLLTDSSGSTKTLEISAPAQSLSESPSGQKVNAVVDITAFKKGYYEVENRDIPVFSGITSIQPVNMIPLPLNASDQKIVFTEIQPNL